MRPICGEVAGQLFLGKEWGQRIDILGVGWGSREAEPIGRGWTLSWKSAHLHRCDMLHIFSSLTRQMENFCSL